MEDFDSIQQEEIKHILEKMKNIAAKFQPMKLLSIGEFALLSIIYNTSKEVDKIKSSDISEKLNISKPAASRMLNVVEEKGYIKRYMEKEDRRVVTISITQAGIDVYKNEINEYNKVCNRIVSKMGQKDMENFSFLVDKFFDIIAQEL
ncbi:MarR family winged helix-turn-helix transcriptional regulator [Clostridium sp. HCP1S3_B4]|uniref:MarR family winged helix-turn-helix transcriptional regulator n=1 Tax=unclassified Clostridium TaxID=2614128 RepID=UPI002A76FB72|nr:MarR family winged helix-turn-helix transcriptional regulator [Clostridiales bacterium]MDY2729318.1 MarR family winged helix-turn-helix transcriptional regulator [Clostridium sp.]